MSKPLNLYVVLRKGQHRDADFHVAYVSFDEARARAHGDKIRMEGSTSQWGCYALAPPEPPATEDNMSEPYPIIDDLAQLLRDQGWSIVHHKAPGFAPQDVTDSAVPFIAGFVWATAPERHNVFPEGRGQREREQPDRDPDPDCSNCGGDGYVGSPNDRLVCGTCMRG